MREYYCFKCGLFFWATIYRIDENGSIILIPVYECPECQGNDLYIVDDLAFYAYGHSEEGSDEIHKKVWCSRKYAPEWAIRDYIEQGVKIKE